jgi:hypothetical protein
MKYNLMFGYEDVKFRRITGIKPSTFAKMIEILQRAYEAKHKRRGRKAKLSIEDMLLASLEYWREYRTYAHIAASYGIHESNLFRIVKWVENTLIADGSFSLPGKKALLEKEADYEIVLLDATESPIERPKKNKNIGIQGKRSATQ